MDTKYRDGLSSSTLFLKPVIHAVDFGAKLTGTVAHHRGIVQTDQLGVGLDPAQQRSGRGARIRGLSVAGIYLV